MIVQRNPFFLQRRRLVLVEPRDQNAILSRIAHGTTNARNLARGLPFAIDDFGNPLTNAALRVHLRITSSSNGATFRSATAASTSVSPAATFCRSALSSRSSIPSPFLAPLVHCRLCAFYRRTACAVISLGIRTGQPAVAQRSLSHFGTPACTARRQLEAFLPFARCVAPLRL